MVRVAVPTTAYFFRTIWRSPTDSGRPKSLVGSRFGQIGKTLLIPLCRPTPIFISLVMDGDGEFGADLHQGRVEIVGLGNGGEVEVGDDTGTEDEAVG